jgi:predicted dehydrogenase
MNIPTTSRRRFLATSLAGTVSIPAWSAPLGANGDIRVAVIGFRGRGGGHIKELLKIPGVRVVALCDVDQSVIDKRVAELAKDNVQVKTYRDFRQCCADKDVDAVTALQHGKHVYVEKPVSHNLIESAKLMAAATRAASKGIIVQHGMQRRSDEGWAAAMEWVKAGHIGKPKLSHALVHGLRMSTDKVDAAQPPPSSVDYKLWSAPRAEMPVMRKQFHYDWHWQWPYGNGDIGNQGPHQYDVARWALGDPDTLPRRVMSFGNRWGYSDDGHSANCQIAFHPYEPVPLIMDMFGLPSRNVDPKSGEPPYKGIRTGNIIHCEGGYVAESKAYDTEGKTLTKFENFLTGPDHMKNFIDSIRAGKYTKDVRERLEGDKLGQDLYAEFLKNLANNGIDLNAQPILTGPWLDFDPVTHQFTGEFAAEANKLCVEDYAAGFELPEV